MEKTEPGKLRRPAGCGKLNKLSYRGALFAVESIFY